MDGYIGRNEERQEFRRILQKQSTTLVTVQGRRSTGKSRFIAECADETDHFFSFMGLLPREDKVRCLCGSVREADEVCRSCEVTHYEGPAEKHRVRDPRCLGHQLLLRREVTALLGRTSSDAVKCSQGLGAVV